MNWDPLQVAEVLIGLASFVAYMLLERKKKDAALGAKKGFLLVSA